MDMSKNKWRAILQQYYQDSNFQNLDKENFPSLLKKLYASDKAFTRVHAISGFEKTEFFPLNKQKIDQKNL